MRVILEVHSGPGAGKKTWLRSGQRITVGRTEGSECVIPHDGQISSRHFALECDLEKCLVRDLDSSNGTFLNGKRIEEAVIRNGDRILAGQTTFAVQIESTVPAGAKTIPPSELVASSLALSPAAALPASPVALPTKTMPPRPPRTSAVVVVPKPYDAGVADKDASVRREALLAAAWTRQKWLLDYCRELLHAPSPENLDAALLLATLGKPPDLQRMLAIGKLVALGPSRFEVLAAFGHPEVVEALLKVMRGENPEDAMAAGLAFTKITGIEIDSENPTPSGERAWAHWRKVRQNYASGTRWRRGLNLSTAATPEMLEQLDLESRWEACLRGAFEGTWNGSLMDLEAFPQIAAR